MKGNYLIFGQDGNEFHFVFSDGRASISYYSMEKGLKALFNLQGKKKITQEEFLTMRDAILIANHLPWKNTQEEEIAQHLILLKKKGILTEEEFNEIKNLIDKLKLSELDE